MWWRWAPNSKRQQKKLTQGLQEKASKIGTERLLFEILRHSFSPVNYSLPETYVSSCWDQSSLTTVLETLEPVLSYGLYRFRAAGPPEKLDLIHCQFSHFEFFLSKHIAWTVRGDFPDKDRIMPRQEIPVFGEVRPLDLSGIFDHGWPLRFMESEPKVFGYRLENTKSTKVSHNLYKETRSIRIQLLRRSYSRYLASVLRNLKDPDVESLSHSLKRFLSSSQIYAMHSDINLIVPSSGFQRLNKKDKATDLAERLMSLRLKTVLSEFCSCIMPRIHGSDTPLPLSSYPAYGPADITDIGPMLMEITKTWVKRSFKTKSDKKIQKTAAFLRGVLAAYLVGSTNVKGLPFPLQESDIDVNILHLHSDQRTMFQGFLERAKEFNDNQERTDSSGPEEADTGPEPASVPEQGEIPF